jgi:hypothetical protein
MEALERLSRAINPYAWNERRDTLTRAGLERVHRDRQAANAAAKRVYAVVGDAGMDTAIAAFDAAWASA